MYKLVKIIIACAMIVVSACAALAVDFTPQGNITLKDRYAVLNATMISTGQLYIGGQAGATMAYVDAQNLLCIANVSAEAEVRAAADTLLNNSLNTKVSSTDLDNLNTALSSSIVAERTQRQGNDSALMGRIDSVNSTVQSEITQRTGNDTAATGRIDALNTSIQTKAADQRVTDLNTSLTTNDSAQATQISQLLGANTTLTNNDSAQATQIGQLLGANTTTNGRVDSLNTTLTANDSAQLILINAKALPGTCAAGQFVQNTTTSGVQCLTPTAASETDPRWAANESRVTNLEIANTSTNSRIAQVNTTANIQTLINGTIDAKIASTTYSYSPSSFYAADGSVISGGLSNLSFADSIYMNLSETVTGFTYYFNFTGVNKAFNEIDVYEFYNGGFSHTVSLQLYNYNTSTWDTITSFQDQGQFTYSTYLVTNSQNYNNSGVVQARYQHSATGSVAHWFAIDYLNLVYRSGGATSGITGSGTANKFPKWSSGMVLDDSSMTQDGYNVSVNGNVTAAWFFGKMNASDVQNAPWITTESDTTAIARIATMPNITTAQAVTAATSANGNWSADKPNYASTSYVGTIGNWTQDKGSYTTTIAGNTLWVRNASIPTCNGGQYLTAAANAIMTCGTPTDTNSGGTILRAVGPDKSILVVANTTDLNLSVNMSSVANAVGNFSANGYTKTHIDTLGNASKHVANCAAGTVIQNITSSGVQCVTDQTAAGGGVTSITRGTFMDDTGTSITTSGTMSVNGTALVNNIGNWSADKSGYLTTSGKAADSSLLQGQASTYYLNTTGGYITATDGDSRWLPITDQRYNETQRITDLNTSLTANNSAQANQISGLLSSNTSLWTNASNQETEIQMLVSWNSTTQTRINSLGNWSAERASYVNTTVGDTRYIRNASIPTCGGTDKLTSAGNGIITCAEDQGGVGGGFTNGSDISVGFLNASTINVTNNVAVGGAIIVGSGIIGSGGNIGGTGTANYIPLFSDGYTLNSSLIYQTNTINDKTITGQNVVINGSLTVNGALYENGGVEDMSTTTYMCSFMVTQAVTMCYPNFLGAAISSGTSANIAGVSRHPGTVSISGATGANSGYYYATYASAFSMNGSEEFRFSMNMTPDLNSNKTWTRIGYIDSVSSSAVADGVYFEIWSNATGVYASGVTANNSAYNFTGNISLTPNQWYNYQIDVNPTASNVTYRIFDDTGTLVWNSTLVRTATTGVPIIAGRETGAGIVALRTTAGTARIIGTIDYMIAEIRVPRRVYG